MAPSGNVFYEENIPAPKAAAFAVANFDLNLSIQENDPLAARGPVPVIIVSLFRAAKENAVGRVKEGERSDGPLRLQGNRDRAKVGDAGRIFVKVGDRHARRVGTRPERVGAAALKKRNGSAKEGTKRTNGA